MPLDTSSVNDLPRLWDKVLGKRGMTEDAAKSNVLKQSCSKLDFRMSRSTEVGCLEHFWTPHEIEYRFRQTGFDLLDLVKIEIPWEITTHLKTLTGPMLPWDWFFIAKVK